MHHSGGGGGRRRGREVVQVSGGVHDESVQVRVPLRRASSIGSSGDSGSPSAAMAVSVPLFVDVPAIATPPPKGGWRHGRLCLLDPGAGTRRHSQADSSEGSPAWLPLGVTRPGQGPTPRGRWTKVAMNGGEAATALAMVVKICGGPSCRSIQRTRRLCGWQGGLGPARGPHYVTGIFVCLATAAWTPQARARVARR